MEREPSTGRGRAGRASLGLGERPTSWLLGELQSQPPALDRTHTLLLQIGKLFNTPVLRKIFQN